MAVIHAIQRLTRRQLLGCYQPATMVDYFALGLTHALLALAAWRLLLRESLDHDPAPQPPAQAATKLAPRPAPNPIGETGDA